MSGRKDKGRIATHPWNLCRPSTVAPAGADPADAEAVNAAAQRVWATIDLRGRRLFHEFTCEGRQTGAHLANMTLIRSAIADQAQKDRRRHAETARKVLTLMGEHGIQTLDPQPGQRVQIICSRVADSMKLGDDPYPALAARRLITTCTRCGENVFLDPLSYAPATPEPVCIRCFHPDLAAAIDDTIGNMGERGT